MEENNHSVTNEVVLAQTENHVELKFTVPPECDFFDGHFPQFKLMPAVGQFEVITRFAKKYFSTQRFIPAIHRMKFSTPLQPNTTVILTLDYNTEAKTVTFSMVDIEDSEKIYSSGTFEVLSEGDAL